MSYSIPLSYQGVSINVTNVAVNNAILAASGVGNRWRILGIHAHLARTAAAGNFELDFQNGVGGATIWHVNLNQPNLYRDQIILPEPGIQLDDNVTLNCNAIGTIAGPTAVRIVVYLFLDSAT